MTCEDVKAWFVHLRLGFQLLLSPVFLWGAMVAGGRIDLTLMIGFVSFHLFGYAGGTALNSYYDRDVGPVGGMEHPPPIPRGLLPFSILWQAVGFAVALAVNIPFAVIYATMFWMSLLYSHPRSRFKGKPGLALLTVALGQGLLAYLGGWTCVHGEFISAFEMPGLLGAAASTGLTVGLYPLTEIYQLDEDRRRGDRTVALWLGPARSFNFAQTFLGLGGLAAIALVLTRYGAQEAVLLAVFLAGVILFVWRWSARFAFSDIAGNFRTLMRLYTVTCLGFAFWIALHLLGVL